MVRIAATTAGGGARRLSLRADPDGGWTLRGSLGIDRRVAGLSAVAHDPSQLLVAALGGGAGAGRDPLDGRRAAR